MNGNGQLKRQATPQPPPQARQNAGLFVPRAYAPANVPSVTDRSLQLNIDSEDDAKSVIQNLQAIKNAYDAAGDLTSVEFCIAESVAKAVENTLLGAICWCRTYIKHIAPQPGNVLFPLPAYKDFSVKTEPPAQLQRQDLPEGTIPVNAGAQPLVKPQRLVRADSARQ